MNILYSQAERKLAALSFPIKVVLPDGTALGAVHPEVTLRVHSLSALAHLVSGNIGLIGEDYVEGRIGFEGSMRQLMAAAHAIMGASPVKPVHTNWLAKLKQRSQSLMRHTLESDASQIQFHYDLSDEFYGLWQDPRRVYSCAYYKASDYSLSQAQDAKLDHICRKLQLQTGERFLDIGAGWGGLLLWAAENYGVDATGITLSKNQHAYVNALIEKKGLSGRVRMLLLDYRKLDVSEPFDKIASVGMFEHVGRSNLTLYFSRLYQLIRPGGLIMNHGITAGGTQNTELAYGMGDFIEKYIFPGGELVHISKVLESVTEGGLETVDVENLRPHYARTLWSWSDALEHQLDRAYKILPGEAGEKSIRAYRLYLAGCAMGFERGWVSLNQVLCQKQRYTDHQELDNPDGQAYPFRRDYMYE